MWVTEKPILSFDDLHTYCMDQMVFVICCLLSTGCCMVYGAVCCTYAICCLLPTACCCMLYGAVCSMLRAASVSCCMLYIAPSIPPHVITIHPIHPIHPVHLSVKVTSTTYYSSSISLSCHHYTPHTPYTPYAPLMYCHLYPIQQ
jgi:hypothetical protein